MLRSSDWSCDAAGSSLNTCELMCESLKSQTDRWQADSLFATSYNRNCLQITSARHTRCGTLTLYTSNSNFDAPIAAMHWSQPHGKCMEMFSLTPNLWISRTLLVFLDVLWMIWDVRQRTSKFVQVGNQKLLLTVLHFLYVWKLSGRQKDFARRHSLNPSLRVNTLTT